MLMCRCLLFLVWVSGVSRVSSRVVSRVWFGRRVVRLCGWDE